MITTSSLRVPRVGCKTENFCCTRRRLQPLSASLLWDASHCSHCCTSRISAQLGFQTPVPNSAFEFNGVTWSPRRCNLLSAHRFLWLRSVNCLFSPPKVGLLPFFLFGLILANCRRMISGATLRGEMLQGVQVFWTDWFKWLDSIYAITVFWEFGSI